MNRSDYWNRETECDNSCNGKDSGIVVCSNPVGNEKLDINKPRYSSC